MKGNKPVSQWNLTPVLYGGILYISGANSALDLSREEFAQIFHEINKYSKVQINLKRIFIYFMENLSKFFFR